ncbi:MAG: hypothetical protein A3G93_00145 [Nitrospinae bacterium RIFCSPLOWO2_12_FULL_45_22]|nr:MAG: hypothetical protein A3G93_00145 [Nitrospinae bacterium RIFCSPLOWO2_12_FULL_45_22]
MELSAIGKRVALEDAYEKVTGKLKFAVDISLPGMLHAKVLRSPYAHAKIVNIDTRKAEALPGVRAIITHKDVPKEEWMELWLNYYGRVIDDRVRFVGDEVAAVAATSIDVAEEALSLIEVEYEELPHVFDLEEAMKPDAPQVSPYGNVREPTIVEWGDIEQGFKGADLIVEHKTRAGSQQHAPVGLNACIATWEGDKLTIWTSAQSVFEIRDVMARYLKMPMSKVRVIGLPTGGSFGLFWLNNFHFIPVFLARKAGKPVKLELTREEIFSTVKRREICMTSVKLGVKRDGTFTAIHMKHYWENGAYGFKTNPYETMSDLWVRNLKHGKFEFHGVSTNLCTAGCMRGVGDLVQDFCMEQAIDKAAEKLGMGPLEIRLKNHSRAGDPQRADVPFYQWAKLARPEKTLSSSGMDKCIKEGAKAIGWQEKWKGWGQPTEVNGSKRRAIGMAVSSHCSGQRYLGTSSVTVKVNQDGSVNLFTGAGRMGQGMETTQAQIVAEVLGVPVESIKGTHGDTEVCPWSVATVASINAHQTGVATQAAAAEAKRQVCELASKELGAKPEDIDIKKGVVFVKGHPKRSIPFADLTAKIDPETGTWPTIIASASKSIPHSPVARFYMAHFAEVEVDTDTGKVKILRYVAVHDSGRIINPSICENQVVSGVLQGCGFALGERLVFDENTGQILNPNFTDYKILKALDVPDPEVIFVEEIDPVGTFGAKGIGEGTVCPCAAALAQAIYNATGVEFNAIPFTPEIVFRALRSGVAKDADESRYHVAYLN